MFSKGDKIALVACSNGLNINYYNKLQELISTLNNMGLEVILSRHIFAENGIFQANEKERADVLINFYKDKSIKAIFDISGGDIANGILNFIDFDIIKNNNKPFFAYSDLTTIINSIYTKTNNISYLYQIKNLIGDFSDIQKKRFYSSLFYDTNELFDFKYKFIRGNKMEGEIVGGNIRCLLKLAGTQFMPDFNNKILFLESMSGGIGITYTNLWQLQQIGVFNKINGIILGTFTKINNNNLKPTEKEMLINILDLTNKNNIPIAVTKDIGHNQNSKCLAIGKNIFIKD